jgi:ribonuclease P protein component
MGSERRGDRLSTRADFSRVYREGRRYAGESLVLYVRPTGGSRRVAVTAGRRLGGAVRRNRARRRLREALRRLEHRLCDRGDIVLVARSQAGTAPFADLVAEMESLCAAGRLLCGSVG